MKLELEYNTYLRSIILLWKQQKSILNQLTQHLFNQTFDELHSMSKVPQATKCQYINKLFFPFNIEYLFWNEKNYNEM